MKYLIIPFFVFLVSGVQAQKKCKLTVTIEYVGIEEGYDHTTKDVFSMNGETIKETETHLESEPLTFTMKIKGGQQTLHVTNWTLYQGTWEETTVENNYSIDAFADIEHNFGKKERIKILYDLDNHNSPIITFE